MKNHERYDENNLEHQQPVIPISQWQEYNDCDGSQSIWEEEWLAEREEKEAAEQ